MRKEYTGKGKTITISADLEEDILTFCKDELNYHIHECQYPSEYETEIEAQIALIDLLGHKELASSFRMEYAEELATEMEEIGERAS